MAVFLSRASQQYAARVNPYTVNATIPPNLQKPVTSIAVTITPTGEWPDGEVGEVILTGPGDVQQRFIFAGSTPFSRGPERGARFYTTDQEPFPPGQYSMAFKVLQTVTVAVLIEYFQ